MLKTDHVFGEHMVLQHSRSVPLCGSATPGAVVHVTLAGKEYQTQTAADGTWRVELEPQAPGGPFACRIVSGQESIQWNDILFGEVLLCSGQSNMEMPVGGKDPYFRCKDFEKLLAHESDPWLRLFDTNAIRCVSPDCCRKELEKTLWTPDSPSEAERFSAAAYCCGRNLRKDHPNVPVGLVHASWGGSRIETWLPQESFFRLGLLDERHENIVPPLLNFRHQKRLESFSRKMRAFLQKVEACGESDSGVWQKGLTFAPGGPQYTAVPRWPCRIIRTGKSFFRKKFMLPESFLNRDLILSLGGMGDSEVVYWNGEKISETAPETFCYWCLERRCRIPKEKLRPGENWVAFSLINHIGLGGWNGPAERITLMPEGSGEEEVAFFDGWEFCPGFEAPPSFTGIPPTPPDQGIFAPASPNYPSSLYQGMIYPLRNMRFRGVLWYQGCSNAGEKEYFRLHTELFDVWRNLFDDPDLPFIVVQLASFYTYAANFPPPLAWINELPTEEEPTYAVTREMQDQLRFARSRIGLVSAIDLGEPYDIHPRDKITLGYRLAKEFERVALGQNEIPQGPEFRLALREGNALRVFFDRAEGLRTSDGKMPGAFAIGDETRLLWAASARMEGGTIVVSHPEIAHPTRVRYAFALARTDINVCNQWDLPLLPFRSDIPVMGE